MTDKPDEIDEVFNKSPINKEVPADIWETIYPTWTGLWTDGFGEWDERQPSDIYPLVELLSKEAYERLKLQLLALKSKWEAEAYKKGYIDSGIDQLTNGDK